MIVSMIRSGLTASVCDTLSPKCVSYTLGCQKLTVSYSLSSHNSVCIIITIGWLRLVGSLKSYVSFAEYRLFYRALLQKRPMILRSLLIVDTTYHLCITVSMIQLCIEYDTLWQLVCTTPVVAVSSSLSPHITIELASCIRYNSFFFVSSKHSDFRGSLSLSLAFSLALPHAITVGKHALGPALIFCDASYGKNCVRVHTQHARTPTHPYTYTHRHEVY